MVRAASKRSIVDRETKILNILSNTSILLMALMTEAFSGLFTEMAEGMVRAVTASLGAAEENTTENIEKLQDLKKQIPKQIIEQMVTMKTDISKQLQAKKHKIRPMIADAKFDEGIRIAEHYDVGLPKMTQELDELSLLSYIALLNANDPACTKLFQELVEWMKTVPQPNGDTHKEK
jgi:predicted RecB family endonuclease